MIDETCTPFSNKLNTYIYLHICKVLLKIIFLPWQSIKNRKINVTCNFALYLYVTFLYGCLLIVKGKRYFLEHFTNIFKRLEVFFHSSTCIFLIWKWHARIFMMSFSSLASRSNMTTRNTRRNKSFKKRDVINIKS